MEADADRVDGPVPDLIAVLPARLRGLAEGYIRFVRTQRVQMFGQGPALSETETGRALLELAAADKATVAVQAYAAWTSERYGGRDGSALRRIVSDLFRAKLGSRKRRRFCWSRRLSSRDSITPAIRPTRPW